jgi:2-phosphosulfolactate phosphatase
MSPDARAAVAAYRSARIPEDIANCPSGRELIEAGFTRDVEIATEVDASESVPALGDGFQPVYP